MIINSLPVHGHCIITIRTQSQNEMKATRRVATQRVSDLRSQTGATSLYLIYVIVINHQCLPYPSPQTLFSSTPGITAPLLHPQRHRF